MTSATACHMTDRKRRQRVGLERYRTVAPRRRASASRSRGFRVVRRSYRCRAVRCPHGARFRRQTEIQRSPATPATCQSRTARVPERLSSDGRAKRGARLRPREMVPSSRAVSHSVRARPDPGQRSPSRVQRFRANFAGVIDAHQTASIALLVRLERRLADRSARCGSRRVDGARQRAQRAVEAENQCVDHQTMITRSPTPKTPVRFSARQ